MDLLTNLRHAARALRRAPVASLVAVATLACGIGANATVFTALRTALLTPPPVVEPDRVLSLTEFEVAHPDRPFGVSFPAYRDWEKAGGQLALLAAYVPGEYAVSGLGEPLRAQVALVSASFFDVTGVRPAWGRVFGAEDDRPGAAPVAVVSDAFWRSRLGADPTRVGTSFVLGGQAATLVGVLPPGFDLPGDAAFYVPLGRFRAENWVGERRAHVLSVLARLSSGASASDVAARLEAVQARSAAIDPGHRVGTRSLQAALAGDLGRPLGLLQATAALLLALACVNLASILAAQVHAQRADWATRRALGASAGSIVRLALTQSLLLAGAGAVAGLLVASWAAPLLAQLAPDPRLAALRVDPFVAAFAAGLALLAGLVAGAVPAWAAVREGASAGLADDGLRHTAGPRFRRAQGALLGAQVACALVLVTGAGLLLGSLRAALAAPTGFDAGSLLTLRVAPPPERYRESAELVAFFESAAAAVRALPGVREVGAVSVLPVSGPGSRGEVSVEDREIAIAARPAAGFLRVLPGYFRAIGVPLVAGRDFDAADDGSPEAVTIVTESLARRLWPGRSAIGRRIKVGPPEHEPWLRVVGVVGDLAQARLDAPPEYQTFEPVAQRPRAVLRFAIRTIGAPAAAQAGVVRAIRALEPEVVLDQATTMDERIGDSLRPRRLQATLVSIFAALAAVIAGLGVYGVASWALTQRRRELGLRMALGARPGQVAGFALREGLRPVALGLVLGTPLAIASALAARGMLFGLAPLDPWVHAASATALLAIGGVACAAPALRASRVSPLDVLRHP